MHGRAFPERVRAAAETKVTLVLPRSAKHELVDDCPLVLPKNDKERTIRTPVADLDRAKSGVSKVFELLRCLWSDFGILFLDRPSFDTLTQLS